MIRCSAIRLMDGMKTFRVNFDYFDMTVSKQCGIQIPQFEVVYNEGFSEDELMELILFTGDNLDTFIDVARRTPAPDLDGEDAGDDVANL